METWAVNNIIGRFSVAFVNIPGESRTYDSERDAELTVIRGHRNPGAEFRLKTELGTVEFDAWLRYSGEQDDSERELATWQVMKISGDTSLTGSALQAENCEALAGLIADALTAYGHLFGEFHLRIQEVKFLQDEFAAYSRKN